MSSIRKIDHDTQTSILAIVIVVGSIVGFIVWGLIASAGGLSIADEEKKCKEIVSGTSIHSGIGGYCDTYIGSDGELHYKYVQTGDPADTNDRYEKDVYIIWETGKGGKY